ncbi:protein FATTY ACID EXPORT 1, chloroplastic isoform X2 [Pistacia vera]|uniref:protein FATTY ACID EXPORT 1, chloroplastic isoform X1 n=1 Tax=Pistacia vera TaxID=55513 RepID=UPI0012635EB9|nr:protein FATTY ACID EXPORT 1, chloroplastic isoform X1 [Pistacia vera]XP_031261079.1 protein FATTY ACID EXPORT 1, chloroplastic isoform X2 [Pistacia vera]
MAATSSQLSSFSAIHRKFHLQQRSLLYPSFRPQKSWVVMCVDRRGENTTSSEIKTTLSNTADESKPYVERTAKSYPDVEEEHAARVMGANEQVHDDGVSQQKKGAKIHDFCFGIPYGSLVLGGGLIGLIFSRNPATFRNIIIGGALLTLSTFSLKTWRQGKSSLPHIIGQAVLSAILLWKNYETYSLTKKLIPTAFYAAISVAMLCFYSYVVLSGGNPPPKKQKSPAVAPS